MEWQSAYYQAPHDFSAYPFSYPQLSQLVKVTPFLSGETTRLMMTNQYGKAPLTFERVAIANQPTMAGATEVGAVTIQPGQTLSTTPVDFQVEAGRPVYVLMVAERPQTYHDYTCTFEPSWVNAGVTRQAGKVPRLNDRWRVRKSWFSFAGLETQPTQPATVVNLTGDSLVETGMLAAGLFTLSQRDFPNAVTWRMTGISGNRLALAAPANQLPEKTFGPALVDRLADLVTVSAKLTVASIGGNDLLLPVDNPGGDEPIPSVESLVQAFTNLKSVLAAHGQELIVPTLAPLRLAGEPTLFQPGEKEVDQKRRTLNQWLGSQPWVVDTAPQLTAPHATVLAPENDFGDHLHLSPTGGRHLAELLWPRIKGALMNN
ncbi:lipolytic protein G-D-S-L family protein [Limosilactobacillus fermentum]